MTTGLAIPKAQPQGDTKVSGHTRGAEALIQLDQLAVHWSWSLAEGGTQAEKEEVVNPK